GAIEEPARTSHVVPRDARGRVCPVGGREQPGRGSGAPAEHGGDELVAIDRERNRTPHATVGQAAVAEVEGEVVDARAPPLPDGQLLRGPEPGQDLGLERILDESDRAASQLERAYDL